MRIYSDNIIIRLDVGLLARIGPLVTAVLLVVSYRVWLFGLRHYTSTGT